MIHPLPFNSLSVAAVRVSAAPLLMLALMNGAGAAEIGASGNLRYGQGTPQTTNGTGASIVSGWQFNVLLDPAGTARAWSRMNEQGWYRLLWATCAPVVPAHLVPSWNRVVGPILMNACVLRML